MPRSKTLPQQQVVRVLRRDGRPDTSIYRWQAPSGRPTLVGIRMLLSMFGELANIGTNVIDHGVRLAERVSFRQQYLPRRLEQYRGQKRLAVLFHGYGQGRAAFETMERVLSSPLFDIFPVVSGYQPYSQDIRLTAERERQRIEWILSRTNVEQVALIGHSQGGLIIRDLVQRQGFVDRVRHAIFLATPHMGTWAGLAGHAHNLAVKVMGIFHPTFRVRGESARQMLPGSEYLRDLNARPLPTGISYVNIYNKIDPLVWPAAYARLPYPQANNVLVMKIGHLQTLYDLQELEMILRALMLGRVDEETFASAVVSAEGAVEAREIQGEGSQYGELVARAL